MNKNLALDVENQLYKMKVFLFQLMNDEALTSNKERLFPECKFLIKEIEDLQQQILRTKE